MRFQPISILFIAVTSLFLGGCASVQMASDTEDMAAKKFVTKPDAGRLYIYRNESMGAAIKMPVSIDGQIVGETASKTYLLLDVKPGAHVIRSHTENTPTLNINAEAGKLYFIWQEVKMGLMQAGSALHQVEQLQGRDGVLECKLAAGGVGGK